MPCKLIHLSCGAVSEAAYDTGLLLRYSMNSSSAALLLIQFPADVSVRHHILPRVLRPQIPPKEIWPNLSSWGQLGNNQCMEDCVCACVTYSFCHSAFEINKCLSNIQQLYFLNVRVTQREVEKEQSLPSSDSIPRCSWWRWDR